MSGADAAAIPARTPGASRRRRLRPLDAALLALALLLAVAAVKEMVGMIGRQHRIARDRRIFERFLAAHGGGFSKQVKVSPRHTYDLVCATHTGARPYRLCGVLVPPGSTHTTVAGGYRLPAHGTDRKRFRYSCFGNAFALKRC